MDFYTNHNKERHDPNSVRKMLEDTQLVWVRDPADGYIQGRITEIGSKEFEVTPIDRKFPKRTCHYDDIHSSCDGPQDHDDNCELMLLNEATFLDNLKTRYYKDKIYTYVANILIAVNPYREIKELYAPDTIKKYNGRSLGELPPHVFAIADKAIRDMRVYKLSQSIIVSGESGAGKTESTKYLLKYLCYSHDSAGPIETKILDANPVLEAFGNAKTTRNNNSSRFGKFIEVHYDGKCQVVGGYISHYLLEKSRICTQSAEERNYHVFYMLLAGAPQQLRDKLSLGKPDDYRYLSGCTQYFANAKTEQLIPGTQKSNSHQKKGPLKDPIIDDYQHFQNLDKALGRLGLSETDKMGIYTLVAAVLHLGNITFEEIPDDVRGGCQVSEASEQSMTITSGLLGVDETELRTALVSRVMQSKGGGFKGTVIMVPLKIYEANNARDALAKAIYSRLFDRIVALINQSIPFQASNFYIGVLDIAGFEYFTVNSFEQFCINYCNEKLQKFFNDNILKNEQELYKREGLNVPEITFTDNQDIIELIEAKANGIFTLLDEESKLPKPSPSHFTAEVHKSWANHYRLGLPRSSRLKAHRTLRDEEGFLVRHFAGAVCYNTEQFIEKNNDALHASLEGLVQECENPLLKQLFPSGSNTSVRGKLNFISVGSKFKTQLGELMEKLEQNGTNFIRCIKPNSKMVDRQFEGSLALAQLKCSGTISVLELMEHGFPSRVLFADLYSMYKSVLPPELVSLPARTFCEAMFQSLNLSAKDFKFGITKVFFRPGKFVEFDRIMRSDPENMLAIVAKVKKWLIRSRWVKSALGALCVIKLRNRIIFRNKCVLTAQRIARGFLARKQHRPRYQGIAKINKIRTNTLKTIEIANGLKLGRDEIVGGVNDIYRQIDDAINKIKQNPRITQREIDSMYTVVMANMNKLTVDLNTKLKEQQQAEEQERLRKIQEALEAERRAKEAEEQRLREEAENKRLKVEMETRRKLAEAQRLKQEEEDRRAALSLQAQLEKEAKDDAKYRQQLEQERRDHELALRLASESNGQVEDSPPVIRNGGLNDASPMGSNKLISFSQVVSNIASRYLNKSENVRAQQQALGKQKFDLSKWKYSELRDAINTSCDIELLEACRQEFHRRLKVYHAWKAKNRKRTTMDENERAPRSVMEAAFKQPPIVQPIQEIVAAQHRYFRIPFMRANAPDNTKRGLWYAHFDGQWIARQMELHADKPPILLVAGTDDMQMCELSLEETGLTRKRGAEILDHEFNREWERNGGKPYKSLGAKPNGAGI
ncbi:myosin heavy chain 95F isoform X1 [Drosophila nasuta]|uniref:Myosin heavy chain 95F isoform X1 n=2 Tax=Drosophila albomicans TaxID=7291 RepID=A0A6P8XLC0_DROAB|nr:myosin heavy chain 95F isoform X1 [Drosophila albomicans]XP_060646293.1 myosin heavy chain 95F isoform X1 [Drosophila nasuta]